MVSKILNTVINILFLSYIILLITFYFMHEGIKQNVSDINTNVVDSITVTGVFSESVYNEFKAKVLQVGGRLPYQITVQYKKKVSPGQYDTYFITDGISYSDLTYTPDCDPYGIISTDERTFPMYKGDEISIYVEAMDKTPYGKLVSMPFFDSAEGNKKFYIKSLQNGIIGKDSRYLESGYNIINEINASGRTYAIRLYSHVQINQNELNHTNIYKNFTKTDRYTSGGYNMSNGSVTVDKIFESVMYVRREVDVNGDGIIKDGDYIEVYETIN